MMKNKKFQINDIVRFDSSLNETYPYEVPETDELGIIVDLMLNKTFQLTMGIELEMALVKFTESKYEKMIYTSDLTLIGRNIDVETDEISFNSEIN